MKNRYAEADEAREVRNFDWKARAFFDRMNKTDNTMSWKRYILLKAATMAFFNIVVMFVLQLVIDDLGWLYLANVVNVATMFTFTGILRKKRGETVVDEPRDITRMVLRVLITAGMPFLIALLSLLMGNELFEWIGGELYIPVMALVTQLLLYGFAYGMMFAIIYALTTD